MLIFKNFPGSMPPDPLELFLFLNQLQIFCAKKMRLKKCENYGPPIKIFRYATVLRLTIRDGLVCPGVLSRFEKCPGISLPKGKGFFLEEQLILQPNSELKRSDDFFLYFWRCTGLHDRNYGKFDHTMIL